jgi:site-specific recombinase XerD
VSRLSDLHRSFSRHLRAEGASERTVAIYGQSVKFFSRWLGNQGRPATVAELNRAAIREWLAQLADDMRRAPSRRRTAALYPFCGWLIDEDELAEHPMKTLSPPQPKPKPVPVLTDAELTALLNACAGTDFNHRRDEAMVRLLIDCGIRVSELCGLTVDGVDLDQGMALVRGKGDKIRRSTSAPGRPARPTVMCECAPATAGRISTRCC